MFDTPITQGSWLCPPQQTPDRTETERPGIRHGGVDRCRRWLIVNRDNGDNVPGILQNPPGGQGLVVMVETIVRKQTEMHRAGMVSAGQASETSMALLINAAIWPRVTESVGQKLVFAGGLHPLVIETSAILLIAPSKIEMLSSVK